MIYVGPTVLNYSTDNSDPSSEVQDWVRLQHGVWIALFPSLCHLQSSIDCINYVIKYANTQGKAWSHRWYRSTTSALQRMWLNCCEIGGTPGMNGYPDIPSQLVACYCVACCHVPFYVVRGKNHSGIHVLMSGRQRHYYLQ